MKPPVQANARLSLQVAKSAVKRWLPGGGLGLVVLLFWALLVATVWVAVALHISFERSNALEQQEARNDELARIFEEHVQRVLVSVSIALRQVGAEYGRRGDAIDLEQYARTWVGELVPGGKFGIVDEQGDVVASSSPNAFPRNLRNTDTFNTHQRDASLDVSFSRPVIDATSGEKRIHLSRRMNGPDGRFAGYAVVSVKPEYLSEFYDQTDLGPDALAEVNRRANNYVGAASITSVVISLFTMFLLLRLHRETRLIEELRVSDERYRLVERGTNDGIWDRDLKSGKAWLSPRARQILDYREGDRMTRSEFFAERLHPDDVAPATQALDRSLAGQEPYRLEYRLRDRDGGYRWILSRGDIIADENGKPARIIGAISDITKEKLAEQHIREQARLLDLIFLHTLDSIVVLDKDYNFVRVSRSYAKAGQRDESEFTGRNHFDLYPSDFEQELASFVREKKVYRRAARRFVFPDHPDWGATYWDLAMVPILDQNGEIELFLFTLRDVSGEVVAEQKAATLLAQIRALSHRATALQEEERRRIARELHDEIGQSLTAVKIRLQTMKRDPGTSFWLDNLEQALSTLGTLLQQVRSLSLDLRPLQLDDFGLAVAIRALVERSAAIAGWKGCFDEDISDARFGPDLELAIYRVAQETLTNVLRHAEATEVSVTLRRSAGALLLCVRDNGRGFEAGAERTGNAMPSLGLLGMEERVGNLGGRFEIRSKPGEATEVRVSVPVEAVLRDEDVRA